MITRQERIALLLLATVSIVLLGMTACLDRYGYSSFAVPYDPSLPDGTLVRLEGMVGGVTPTRTGGHLSLDVSGVHVFITGGASLTPPVHEGEHVAVVGVMTTYRGSREISVRSGSDLVCIACNSTGENPS